MKYYFYTLLFLFAGMAFPTGLSGQNLSVSGEAAVQTMVSNSGRQPFYFWANRLGQVPVEEQYQLFTRVATSVVHQLPNQNRSLFGGINVNLRQTQNTAFNLPELYGGFQSRYFQLTGGLFADSLEFYGLSPSNGNFMVTRNAPPHPRMRLGTNRFIRFWEIPVYFAALYEEGMLNDHRWVNKAKLHHKNLFLRWGDPEKIELTAGLNHFIFWGGHTSSEDYTPDLKDYIRTLFAGSYYAESIDMMNTIGNQLGQYRLMIRKSFPAVSGTFQVSHIFEDPSGVNFMNYPDNMYTLLLTFKNSPRLKNVLLEYTHTKHQSGPATDPETGASRPSSGDNYFSHSQYRSGFTYQGYFIGTPLFGPLRYTEDGMPNGPANNRFSAIHLGLSGKLFPSVDYKLMATHSQNFGRRSAPYEPVRNQFFSMASVRYTFPARPNLYAEGQAAFDSGKLWTGEHAINAGLNLSFGFKF
jgi:hypothetical protein